MYRATTRDISVSVEPFFIEEQSEPDSYRWVFGYRVTIENSSPEPIQLMSRYLRITDGQGRLFEVRGDGVLGEQPVIEPGSRYQYTSGTPLKTPSAIMTGTYQMQDSSGLWFDVRIPPYSLDAPGSLGPTH